MDAPSDVDAPYIFAIIVTLFLLFGFIYYIQKKYEHRSATDEGKKRLNEAKYSIISTIAFLIANLLYWVPNILLYHPFISSDPERYCMAFRILRSTGAFLLQYCMQMFFVFRIRVILHKLNYSEHYSIVYKILLCLVNVHFIFVLTNSMINNVKSPPELRTISVMNFCGFAKGSNISAMTIYTLGIIQLLLFVVFLSFISKIICFQLGGSTSKRIIRTIVANAFVTVRLFLLPYYIQIEERKIRSWVIALSVVFNALAVLSDYYDYNILENIVSKSSKQNVKNTIELNIHKNDSSPRATNTIPSVVSSNAYAFPDETVALTFLESVDNGFTGKNIDAKFAICFNRFWQEYYLKLSEDTKDELDKSLHNKLKHSSIQLPHYYESKSHFPYLKHLNKLFVNLIRLDIDLEDKLRRSWGKLHQSLNITENDCQLVFPLINETFHKQFGRGVYTPSIEYVFERIYTLAMTMMFGSNTQGFLSKIIDLNENEKEIISSSFEACMESEAGRDIMHGYVSNRSPEIYVFFKLMWEYESCGANDDASSILVNLIHETCIKQDAMFALDISDDLRNRFIQCSDQRGQVLSVLKQTQMDKIKTLYWKTFVMFVY